MTISHFLPSIPPFLLIGLEKPVLDLVNKDGNHHGVGPDVLEPQADQVPAPGGNVVTFTEYQYE